MSWKKNLYKKKQKNNLFSFALFPVQFGLLLHPHRSNFLFYFLLFFSGEDLFSNIEHKKNGKSCNAVSCGSLSFWRVRNKKRKGRSRRSFLERTRVLRERRDFFIFFFGVRVCVCAVVVLLRYPENHRKTNKSTIFFYRVQWK